MCVKGWKMDRFNPAKIPVITHEMDHEPEFLDLRGGPKSAGIKVKYLQADVSDHVDILGRAELNVSHLV
jgi:phospholipid:diacylglycerol acyltransferase